MVTEAGTKERKIRLHLIFTTNTPLTIDIIPWRKMGHVVIFIETVIQYHSQYSI